MINPFLILVVTFVPIIYLAVTKTSFFKQLLKDLRLGRITHYFILFLFGFVLFKPSFLELGTTTNEQFLQIILYYIILIYAAIFAIATNNKEDIEIDKISNTNRPLVQNTVDLNIYLTVAKISLILALLFAFLTNFNFLLAIFSISFVYFLYSCKPFKFKRFVFIAKFLIGLNSFISAVCGFVLAGGTIIDFPIFWIFFILVPVSLMANFVDLKDTEGDRAAGIKTLPVLLGNKKATYIISLFILLAYLAVVLYFHSWTITCVVCFGAFIHLILLFKQPYKEKYLLILHNFLFLGLIFLLLIQNQFNL